MEGVADGRITAGPVMPVGRDTKSLAHVLEVEVGSDLLGLRVTQRVTQLLHGTWLGDVVGVHSCLEEGRADCHRAVRHGDEALRWVVGVDTVLLLHLVAFGECLGHLNAGANVLDCLVEVGVDCALVVKVAAVHRVGISHAVSDHNRLEVDGLLLGCDEGLVVVVHGRRKDWEVSTAVGLPGHVELAALKLLEGIEENGDEGSNVLACFLGSTDHLAVLGLTETDVDWLINKEDVGTLVPRVIVDLCVIDILGVVVDCAGTELHEQADGGGAARATVDPHDHRVFLWLVSGLEEVEEQLLAASSVNVTRVRVDTGVTPALGALDADLVVRVEGTSENVVLIPWDLGEGDVASGRQDRHGVDFGSRRLLQKRACEIEGIGG